MFRPRRSSLIALLGAILMLLNLTACAPSATPTPTPDYPALETAVAFKLSGTLTAKAPTPTTTATATTTPLPPTPTATARPTATATATPTPPTSSLLAFVRIAEDQVANLMFYDLRQGVEEPLTHFAEPLNMGDVSWSPDGQWVAFVSAHDFIHSRNQERNLFLMRSDGTELHMVTGDYVEPKQAPGPYVLLKGRVLTPGGACVVCAQGAASPATAAEDGSFELAGVPASARWARAVCQQDDLVLQGDVDLDLQVDAPQPITIEVRAEGRGWSQASVSAQGDLIAGTVYTWTLDADKVRQVAFHGEIITRDGEPVGRLVLPPESTLLGVDWSPITNTLLVGALTDEKGTGLYTWDNPSTPELLLRLDNPDDQILSAAHPVWSPDASQIAFELRQWSWWGENRYRTVLMVWDVGSADKPRLLVEPEWGDHAAEPSWSADGRAIFYQLSDGEPGVDYWHKQNGNILAVPVAKPSPTIIFDDGRSYLPAARPERPLGTASQPMRTRTPKATQTPPPSPTTGSTASAP
ncbi:MAG: PD40 domain-containing protein [Chloroflexi bacterium]|nr:PD40 domain-containing protein [Chloroflexota bacterium]